MANFDTIKTAIDANINTNGTQEITGGKMNSILKQVVDATGEQLTELESEIVNLGEDCFGSQTLRSLVVSPIASDYSVGNYYGNRYDVGVSQKVEKLIIRCAKPGTIKICVADITDKSNVVWSTEETFDVKVGENTIFPKGISISNNVLLMVSPLTEGMLQYGSIGVDYISGFVFGVYGSSSLKDVAYIMDWDVVVRNNGNTLSELTEKQATNEQRLTELESKTQQGVEDVANNISVYSEIILDGYDSRNDINNDSYYNIFLKDLSGKTINKVKYNCTSIGTITLGIIKKEYVVVGQLGASADKYIDVFTLTPNAIGENEEYVSIQIPDGYYLWVKKPGDVGNIKAGINGNEKGFIRIDNNIYVSYPNATLNFNIFALKDFPQPQFCDFGKQGVFSKSFIPKNLLVNSGYIPDFMEINEKVGFVGRWYKKTINNVDCVFTTASGSELYFKTKGATSFTLNFLNTTNTKNYVAYSIDGNAFTRILISSPTVSLPNDDEHTIRIVCDGITDSVSKWKGDYGFAFVDVTVDNGDIIGIIPRNPLIAFYGDSITEGLRALGTSSGVSDYADINSAISAFPFYCCQQLNTISYRVGYGATGIDVNGSFHPTIDSVKYFANGVSVETFYPSMIVINIGTNDYIHETQSDTFVSGYINVIETIHRMYPGAVIFCMIPFNQYFVSEITGIAENYDYCHLIETAGWNIDKVDNYHPSVAGALTAGTNLATVLKEYIY